LGNVLWKILRVTEWWHVHTAHKEGKIKANWNITRNCVVSKLIPLLQYLSCGNKTHEILFQYVSMMRILVSSSTKNSIQQGIPINRSQPSVHFCHAGVDPTVGIRCVARCQKGLCFICVPQLTRMCS
jgi:hypothetical protein